MGDKVGTSARGNIPGKVPTLWVTDAPQQAVLSHGLHFFAGRVLIAVRRTTGALFAAN